MSIRQKWQPPISPPIAVMIVGIILVFVFSILNRSAPDPWRCVRYSGETGECVLKQRTSDTEPLCEP